MITPIRSHFLVHLPGVGAGLRHGGKSHPLGQPAIPIPLERIHGSNERDLFELGHKWSKLFLSFGTQDLERQFSAQVSSYGWQAQGLIVIHHGFFEKPSTPLGTASATLTSHDYVPQPPFPYFYSHDKRNFVVQMTLFKKYPNRTDGTCHNYKEPCYVWSSRRSVRRTSAQNSWQVWGIPQKQGV